MIRRNRNTVLAGIELRSSRSNKFQDFESLYLKYKSIYFIFHAIIILTLFSGNMRHISRNRRAKRFVEQNILYINATWFWLAKNTLQKSKKNNFSRVYQEHFGILV
jgi:hypothetical protein